MGKGTNSSGSRHSNYTIKKRCQFIGCKKRAKYKIGECYFCKKHWDRV